MSNDLPEQQPEEQPEEGVESHTATEFTAVESGDPAGSSAAEQPEELSTSQSGGQSSEPADVRPEFRSGDRVRVKAMPVYLKTADTMPMLRPPDLIRLGEEGIVTGRRPGQVWSVRFERGTFLMDGQCIERLSAAP